MKYVSKNNKTGLYYSSYDYSNNGKMREIDSDIENAKISELTIEEYEYKLRYIKRCYIMVPYNQELQEIRKLKLQKLQNI